MGSVSNGETLNGSAKAAHVNVMTDTIIASLPTEGLRSVLRGLLGVDANVTPAFHALVANYLDKTRPASIPALFRDSVGLKTTPELYEIQRRYRCLMGCGQGFDSLNVLRQVVLQTQELTFNASTLEDRELMDVLAVIDSDLVQALTAVRKELLTSAGVRPMNETELRAIQNLRSALVACKRRAESNSCEFVFERGLSRLDKVDGRMSTSVVHARIPNRSFVSKPTTLETITLGQATVPRMFMGLWQFSSPAWGTASKPKINAHFRKHVDAGFVAYDMADHYGDAEVIFGQFRSSQPDSNQIYCATKWAVFDPISVTPEVVEANITERLTNINADKVELLQFHWQDYHDPQYVKAAKLIEQDPRVKSLGLCNFDTQRMDEVLENGVKIVSNQVQFSLIDVRPTFKMADSCRKHDVKLLTYGSLCGGLLADRWLGVNSPSLFDEGMTPSSRKYLEMIMVWGGWTLFQELLLTLSTIGKKYAVSISIVAIRWVLDHGYVGAVIIGARMGISEHTDENSKVFSFQLDEEDKFMIQKILDRCRAPEVFDAMGDCGSEYR